MTDRKTPEEIAAQLWCLPQHSRKEMDCDFALSIAAAIRARDALHEQEIAAIRQAIVSAELPTGDTTDALDLMGVFIEHHKAKEAELSAEREVSDGLAIAMKHLIPAPAGVGWEMGTAALAAWRNRRST